MKYYAVTDDPRELMHYGILGMKWGVLRTPAQLGHIQPPKMPKGMKAPAPRPVKSRSDAYQRASAKLSAGMRRGIRKAKASIREYQSPAAKAERRFQKHLEQARKGTLKYKKVTDDEVYRITERLNMEKASRSLSGTEQQSFAKRFLKSAGEGIIQGAGKGISNRTEEWVSRGGELKTQRLKKEQDNALDRQQKLWNQEQDRRQELWKQQKDREQETWKQGKAREQTLWDDDRKAKNEQRDYDLKQSRREDKFIEDYNAAYAKTLGLANANLYKEQETAKRNREEEAANYARDQERKRLEQEQHLEDIYARRIAPNGNWETSMLTAHDVEQDRIAEQQKKEAAKQRRLERAAERQRLADEERLRIEAEQQEQQEQQRVKERQKRLQEEAVEEAARNYRRRQERRENPNRDYGPQGRLDALDPELESERSRERAERAAQIRKNEERAARQQEQQAAKEAQERAKLAAEREAERARRPSREEEDKFWNEYRAHRNYQEDFNRFRENRQKEAEQQRRMDEEFERVRKAAERMAEQQRKDEERAERKRRNQLDRDRSSAQRDIRRRNGRW